MNSLRLRFIASHLAPLMIIPVMAVVMIIVLEAQVVLANLSSQQTRQAQLLANIAHDYPDVWRDDAKAAAFVDRFGMSVLARVTLVGVDGGVRATNAPPELAPGIADDLPIFRTALSGEIANATDYSQDLQARIADVMVPVQDEDGNVEGVIWLSYQLSTVRERFYRLRFYIGAITIAALAIGAIAGLWLALTLEHPLQQVTQTIYQIAHGEGQQPVDESGPRELRMLSHAVNNLIERLNILRTSRRQLLSNLVHEIGQPLGALRAANDALLAGADEDPTFRRELLTGMDRQFRVLKRLLDDLTRFYDQALGEYDLDLAPIELSSWLATLAGPWREIAQRDGLQWRSDIPSELPVIVADSDRLGQAVSNLLSNAVRYTPAGGTIEMVASAGDEGAVIEIGDTGVGIDPAEQERIFEPFYRGQPKRLFAQGMGLGLAISRDLVQAHGGRLTVASLPGRGSRFTITLPYPALDDLGDVVVAGGAGG